MQLRNSSEGKDGNGGNATSTGTSTTSREDNVRLLKEWKILEKEREREREG